VLSADRPGLPRPADRSGAGRCRQLGASPRLHAFLGAGWCQQLGRFRSRLTTGLSQTSGAKADLIARILEAGTTSAPPASSTSAPTTAGSDDGVGDMRVADLKSRLKALGAKTTGTKAELQTRLRAHLFLADDEDAAAAPPDVRSQRAPAKPAHEGAGESAAVTMSRRPDALKIAVGKSQKRKGVDELGLTRQDRDALLRRRVLSLYRRCLRSADRCPDDGWRLSMMQYVRGRFRDSSTDAIPIRIAMGESELEQMDGYHKAREDAQAQKQRKLEEL
jgi:hypothetical protein